MDFRKELNDVAEAYELQEQANADLMARVEFLENQIETGGGTVNRPLPPPPPLKRFDTLADLEAQGFERWPDNDDTKRRFNQLYVMTHRLKGAGFSSMWPPERNAIIRKLGAWENVMVRPYKGKVTPEEVQVCNHRVCDVTANVRCAIVQDGDNGDERDVADIEALCANYQGGLNKPLSYWRDEYAAFAKILAQHRPDLVGDWEWARLGMAAGGGTQ